AVLHGARHECVPLDARTGGVHPLADIFAIADAVDGHAQHEAGKASIAYQEITASAEHKDRKRASARPAQSFQDVVVIRGLDEEAGASSYLQRGVRGQPHVLLYLHHSVHMIRVRERLLSGAFLPSLESLG